MVTPTTANQLQTQFQKRQALASHLKIVKLTSFMVTVLSLVACVNSNSYGGKALYGTTGIIFYDLTQWTHNIISSLEDPTTPPGLNGPAMLKNTLVIRFLFNVLFPQP